MNSIQSRAWRWGVLCLMGFMLGCGPGTEKAETTASGKVTLDGAPLTGGVVLFVPRGGGGEGASGQIQPDGTFVVRTTALKSGVDPGEYAVFIKPTDDMTDGGGIPAKYSNEEQAELGATIPKGGTNDLHFELKSK